MIRIELLRSSYQIQLSLSWKKQEIERRLKCSMPPKKFFLLSGPNCSSSSLLKLIMFILYSQISTSVLKDCSTALARRNVKIFPEATDVCVQRG